MSRTRFKILAGLFALAVGCLVAVGQPPVCIPQVQQAGIVPCPPAPVVTVQATVPFGLYRARFEVRTPNFHHTLT